MNSDYPNYKNVSKTNDQNINLSENFVSAAIQYDKNDKPCHAGIAICFEGEINIFHYNGFKILLEKANKDNWYVQNKFTFFDDEDAASFLRHCRKILKNYDEKKGISPNYGFYYNGAYFEDGKYYSDISDFQYMTCVGFCLAVITGAIEAEQFFNHEEWNDADHLKRDWFENYMESYLEGEDTETIEKIKKHVRRIPPIDYFTSSFCTTIPIKYTDVKVIRDEIHHYVKDNFIKSV